MRAKIPSWVQFVQPFAEHFSSPTFDNFVVLSAAWLLTRGPRTVTRLIQTASEQTKVEKHFSVFHRFFCRANWNLDALGFVVVGLLLPFVSTDADVIFIVDDTLCRRSGPRILGAGMHHDPLTSPSSGKKHTGFAFGLNFVVLAVWLKVPFSHSGGIAVPILVRLYRSKRTCPKPLYRKRTELAASLVTLASQWFSGRRILVLADHEYACQTLLTSLPAGVDFCGPLPLNASLHDPHVQGCGLGRPKVWGNRLPSPAQLLTNKDTLFTRQLVPIYGAHVSLDCHRFNAVWRSAGSKRTLSVVISRDPSGRYKPAAFFSTRQDDSAAQVLVEHSKRWELEVTFRNTKQHLGLEDTANGFTRRRRKGKKRPGPQPMPGRLPIASARTAPFAFIVHGITVAWYLRHGDPRADIDRVKQLSPWYRQKKSVSFSDMLDALRRSRDAAGHFSPPLAKGGSAKILAPPPRPFSRAA